MSVLRFLGAAGTVTGSKFLVETERARVLVDCGLFQGLKELRLRNWAPLPVKPESIDAVVLSHAHLDHSGYVPALVKQGFRGHVFATPNTRALCRILLPDAGHLQEEEAGYANKKGYSKHRPALPLYTSEDAELALARFRAADFDQVFEPAPGVSVTFRHAGHILGAASVHLQIEQGKGDGADLLVSGDLGRPQHPILRAPDPPPAADNLLVESTYGNRVHADEEALELFAQAIVRTAERSGAVLIPAFAVDRTEVVLHHLKQLADAGRIPELPIYVDSPMALSALAVYRRAIAEGSPEIREHIAGDDAPFRSLEGGNLIEARDVNASKAIHDAPLPAILISASGMITGGRILHHIVRRLPDAKNTVLLVGYQAAGTRGQTLQAGATSLKMLGRYVPVRAEIVTVPAFSVHADQGELVDWLAQAPKPPRQTFVVHGEPDAAAGLRDAIDTKLGWGAVVPHYNEVVCLD
jgi:metallo-beta-lactamase family protein